MRAIRRGRMAALVAVILVVGLVPTVAFAAPADQACESRNFTTVQSLLACVDADDVFVHLQALQDIADANEGTRASGTPGYDASADYVANLLEDAGYSIERQVFDYPFFVENTPGEFEQTAPTPTSYGYFVDFAPMNYSGSGDVTAATEGVDLQLADPSLSTSGCEASDFSGFTAGNIALIQRGACSFALKATNAEAAGAVGVVVFNQGTPGREPAFLGTLGGPGVTIPVVGTSFAIGEDLVTNSATVRLFVDATQGLRQTENVIADMDGVNTDNVVMAGAHLDSVAAGPGVQDNGSGSAAILAVALALADNKKYVPQNSLRFAWWGAEESGLIGSNEYVFNPDFGLTLEEYNALSSYLNFDMIASPNFIYGVYDADESTFEAPVPVPPGSEALEDLFEAYYSDADIPYEDSEFSGRSDYQAFINVGIPASGLFTGAEVIKTDEQAAIWGGTAGDQYDPCYHLACDTIDNVSHEAIDVNVDAVAFAMFYLAASTESVNGVKGVQAPGPKLSKISIDGPQGTFLGGGGLESDHHDAVAE